LDEGLQRLVEAEFLMPGSEPTRQSYLFKHALIQDAAYESLLRRSRITNHRHIAEVIEQQFHDIATQQPELVARHYEAGKCAEKAVQLWLKAGQQSLQRNAHMESVAHVRNGLRLIGELPDNSERTRNDLDLEITLIPALIAANGYAAPEVEVSCKRAMELCDTVGEAPQKFPALFGLWTFHCVRANHATSLELACEFLKLADAAKNEALILEGYLIVGIAHFFQGHLSEALASLDKCIGSYDRGRHGDHAFRFGQDPGVVAFNHLSWVHWLLGDPQKAFRYSDQAISLARSLGHPFTLSFALTFAAWLRLWCHERESAEVFIREDVQLCTDQQIQIFLAYGQVLSGWSTCESGNVVEGIREMKAALEFFQLIGARCYLPYWEAFFAMAHAAVGETKTADELVRQAFAEMERSGERWSEAELHRYCAVLLTQQGAGTKEIEQSYRHALEVADRQGATAWSLRAATGFAQWLKDQGKESEGRDVLERVIGTFPPDATSRDLADARSLFSLVSQS
jgi:predicted ATPase